MSADALHHPPLMPHLLVDGLNRYNDEPCLYLGDRVASYRAGFLPEERAWVSSMLELGYRDVFRDRNPGEKGHYTWWTYRANARARNIGWRLDYFLVTPGLAEKVKDVVILADVMGSDHCPVRLELDL